MGIISPGRRPPQGRFGFLALLACLAAAPINARAAVPDYAADPTLATTTVDISSISTRPARLIDILTLVESQTNFEFIYLPRQIPINDRIAVESGKSITLARLFYSISSLTGVVFTRHSLKVTILRDGESDRPTGAVSPDAGPAPEKKTPSPSP